MDPVQLQYQANPYPTIPLLARLARSDLHTLNFKAISAAAFGTCAEATDNPRVLVLGCGTFEPCAIALGNPTAEIHAVDFSEPSLRRLRWHLRRHGLGKRVTTHLADLLELPSSLGKFDLIVATGVLHHLEDPQRGFAIVTKFLNPLGVARIMYYSRFGRSWIYRIQGLAKKLRIKSPSELYYVIGKLPSSHPLKIHFHLYQDVHSKAGCIDGFLHARDTAASPKELGNMLEFAGLSARAFHMPRGSRPQDFPELIQQLSRGALDRLLPLAEIDDWDRLQIMDALGEVESNFKFLATHKNANRVLCDRIPKQVMLNPYIRDGKLSSVYSNIQREQISVSQLRKLLTHKKDIKSVQRKLGAETYQMLMESSIVLEE